MKAILQRDYGDPGSVLVLEEVEKPTPTAGEVLVRVHASSVNAGDHLRVRGRPLLIHLVEGVRRPRKPGLGGDVAGVVEAVGDGVADLRPGDDVFGVRTGAFAEYVASPHVVRKPANASFEQAAATPIVGLTALQAVRDKGKVQAGQRVLVNGAGGGVGTFALQIAKAFGAEVTAATSSAKVELVRSLGADHVIDYTREDFTRAEPRYDVIFDVGGTPPIGALRRALAPAGTLVRVGAGKGRGGPVVSLVASIARSRLFRQRVVSFISKADLADLNTLRELIEAGKLTPVIDRTYPLSDVPEALRYVESGRARGKVVITVAAE